MAYVLYVRNLAARKARKAREQARLQEEHAAAVQARIDLIMSRKGEWGEEMCKFVIEREVALDMTQEMVRASWGEPRTVDQKEITKTLTKERWVYGANPRNKGKTQYVHFSNGKVSKIATS